jgi:hypothetical protein
LVLIDINLGAGREGEREVTLIEDVAALQEQYQAYFIFWSPILSRI